MKTLTLGNPTVLKKPYTRFYIHYLDIPRMEEVLEDNDIPYFAMETRVSQINWILHIPDENRKEFDALVVGHNFNLSQMNHSFWYQDRERDAMWMGSRSKPARSALIVAFLVVLILVIVGMIF